MPSWKWKSKSCLCSWQLISLVVFTIMLETCHTLSAKGFYVSLTLGNLNVRSLNNLGAGGKFKEIQNANEMSRNNRLSMLSHPAIKHFAHFLFPSPLKYFSRDARKSASLQQARIRGLLRVFLIKTALSASPAVYFILFFCWSQCFFLRKTYRSFFFTNEYSVPRSRMMTSSRRNKRIKFSGKENTHDIFKRHLVTRLHAFSP